MNKVIGSVSGVMLILAIWQVAEWIWNFEKYILPSPSEVWHAVQHDWRWLLESSWPTVQEIVLGFGLSVLIGLPLAIMLVASRRLEKLVYPTLVISQTMPMVAIAPLFLIWFGFGMTPKILIACIISFFPVVVASTVGLKSVPDDLHDLVASTGASWWLGLRRVRLLYALPSIFGGLKVAITLATIGAIVGEFVGTSEGLGYVIQFANGKLNTPLVFAAVMLLSAIGLTLFRVVSLIERLAIPWHSSQTR